MMSTKGTTATAKGGGSAQTSARAGFNQEDAQALAMAPTTVEAIGYVRCSYCAKG